MIQRRGNNFIRRKREGSALVSVVIGVLFLAAIGVIVLTVANKYMISVSVDHNESSNFYEAEGILEEVKSGLLEYAGESSEEAYRYILQNYSKDKDTKREVFSKKYLSALANKLLSGSTFSWDDNKLGKAQNCDINKIKCLSQKPDAVKVVKNTNAAFVINKDSQNGEYTLVIRNVLIDYTNEADYRTSVQADICMTVPDYNLEGNSTFDALKDYISISDGCLQVEDYKINNSFAGNIYAGLSKESENDSGKGILLGLGSGADFKGATIVSRSDLEVRNGATASFAGEDGIGDLYVKNIHLMPGGDPDSTMKTRLSLNENSYVANDLNIEANNSIVSLGGRYYGYSYNEKNEESSSETVNSEYSSAILVNGKNTTLKTENLNSLVLAGRAFVSRENKDQTKVVSDIMMGESIAVKSNQLAYLVPDEFIISASGSLGDYHNPVLKSELEEKKVQVDEQGLKDKFGSYLNPDKPYQANYNNTIGYVFYYLQFKDDASANQYFEKYFSGSELDEDGVEVSNKSGLTEKGKVYISNEDLSIKFDQTLYLVAGNVLNNYYGTGGASLQKATYFGSNQKPSTDLLREGKRMGQSYVGYQLGLSPGENASGIMRLSNPESNPMVASSLLDFSKMTQNITKGEADTGVSGAEIKVIQGDYSVDAEGKGLLIVKGNVTVNSNFTGLILATGKVTVSNSGVKLQSDMVTVAKLFDYIRTDKTLVPLFRDLNGTAVKRSSDLGQCFYYQNWTKNTY